MQISRLITLVLLLILSITTAKNIKLTKLTALFFMIVVVVTLSFMFAYIPDNVGDRLWYILNYNGVGLEGASKGWDLWIDCFRSFDLSVNTMFLVTALFYLSTWLAFAINIDKGRYNLLLVSYVLAFPFIEAYAINTTRFGLASAFLLLSLLTGKIWLKVIIAYFAYLVHETIILPILVIFLVTRFISVKHSVIFWFIGVTLSFFKIIDLENALQIVGISDYDSKVLLMNTDLYENGLTLGKLFLSVLPLIIYRVDIRNWTQKESEFFKVYFVLNGFWFAFLDINFNDRIGAMSWLVIPFLIYFFVIKHKVHLESRLFVFVFFYFSINLLL